MFRTHVKCEGCQVDTHTWYDMGDEGNFCPICYCVWYLDLADESDHKLAEDFAEQEEREKERDY